MATTEPQTTKFTPDPWHVGPYYESDVESREGRICECLPFQSPRAVANARLIALAPELYAALKAITSRFEGERDIALGNGYPEDYAAIETAKTILAKVEGR